jgi:hypothetical protein
MLRQRNGSWDRATIKFILQAVFAFSVGVVGTKIILTLMGQ